MLIGFEMVEIDETVENEFVDEIDEMVDFHQNHHEQLVILFHDEIDETVENEFIDEIDEMVEI